MDRSGLQGRRILVVEDNWLVGFAIADTLKTAGATVVGPAVSLQEATAWAQGEPPEAAVLDINIDGRSIVPVARILANSRVPFMVVTAYDKASFSEPAFEGIPWIRKPFTHDALIEAVEQLFSKNDRELARQEQDASPPS